MNTVNIILHLNLKYNQLHSVLLHNSSVHLDNTLYDTNRFASLVYPEGHPLHTVPSYNHTQASLSGSIMDQSDSEVN